MTTLLWVSYALSFSLVVLDIVVLVFARKARIQYERDRLITFNQLSAANQRLGALIAMQGYSLDDVERFAKQSVMSAEPEEGAQPHPKLDTELTA